MHYFVDGTLLIYEGIREHVKQGFLPYEKYFQNIFIKLLPYYELFVAIHSLPGRILHMPFFFFYCALPTETAG